MWERIRRWFGAQQGGATAPATGGSDGEFKWYDPGSDNPFGMRVLDVRSLTWNVVATTTDPRIAESFSAQRQTDGREFIDAKIADSTTVPCRLTFPHNGERLEGIAFKADSMDVKWDIYIYDSVFLFVRSWTGALQYRAKAEVGPDAITIHAIETSAEHADTAAQAVYFLLATHAMGRVLPHTIPRDTPNDPQQIAVRSFSLYGKHACYATYEDITQITIARPGGE